MRNDLSIRGDGVGACAPNIVGTIRRPIAMGARSPALAFALIALCGCGSLMAATAMQAGINPTNPDDATVLRRRPTVFRSAANAAPTPNHIVNGSAAETGVILGVASAAFDPVNPRRCIWNAAVIDGSVQFNGLMNAIGIDQGKLYIRTSIVPAGASPATTAYPIVITKGTTNAGSIGTAWYCEATVNSFTIVLVDDPISNSANPKVGIEAKCRAGGPACLKELVKLNTYFVITDGVFDSDAPLDLSTNPALATRVVDAKQRADAVGLR